MPLPSQNVERVRVHKRHIAYEGFERIDGLWDIEAHLIDTKDQDFEVPSGVCRGGEALHHLSVRVTIDSAMTIIDVVGSADATPFVGSCERILPDYSKIIGLNLLDSFLKTVKDLFGGVRGCSHVSELLMSLPTAAIQALYGRTKQEDNDQKPFPLDKCHALSSDSEVVQRYFPRWYRNRHSGEGIL